MTRTQLILKEGREKSLLRRHPWIFSGAVAEMRGDPESGATVEVLSSHGDWLARAAYSPHSQIRARIWSFDPDQAVDADFIRQRLEAAIRARDPYRAESDALRLIHAESDGLPGLVLDQYGEVLVAQFLSAGAEHWKDEIADFGSQIAECKHVYERSDADVRTLEGLESADGWLRGEGRTQIKIEENGLKFQVDLAGGHKTGFYLDQRRNRLRVRQLAAGRDVLDCFAYTGGFAVNVLAGDAASVTLVEESAGALAEAEGHAALNGLPADKMELIEADVFSQLRSFRDGRRSFDMIILDPPKFAPTRSQVERAARGYKDINLLAFKLLRPGGLLVTFSCSGGVDAGLFQKIVAGAALDAGVDARILERLSQAPDHPVALPFPEGEYLKGLICQIG
jgi:23S rRNA (cytosine1962-C5)-methyltransferase